MEDGKTQGNIIFLLKAEAKAETHITTIIAAVSCHDSGAAAIISETVSPAMTRAKNQSN
jgi:hypothetical protein